MGKYTRYFFVTLCLLAAGMRSKAQETLDFNQVESRSYAFYLEKNWSELLKLGNRSLAAGIDYYYLRLRMGIACYEQQKYRAAIPHFEQALHFSSGETLAQEYLYYCYLYSERNEHANWLSKSFDPLLAGETKTHKSNRLGFVAAEGGIKFSDSSRLFRPATFSQMSASHLLKKRVSLFHALSWYYQDENRFTVNQAQYYLRVNIPFKNDWLLSAGLHVFGNTSDFTESAVKESTFTPAPPFPGAPTPPVRTQTVLEVSQVNEQTLGLASAFMVTKHLPLADFSLGSSFLILDTARQITTSLALMYYPFKNNRLSLGGTMYLQQILNRPDLKPAFAPQVNVAVGKRLFFTATYFVNKGLNIPEQTAYFMNNSVDFTTHRLSISPLYMLNKKWSLYAVYSYETKSEIEKLFLYHYHITMAGIRYFL